MKRIVGAMNFFLVLILVIASNLCAMEDEQHATIPDRVYYTRPERYAYDEKSRTQVPGLSQSQACLFCTKLAKDPTTLADTDPDKYFVVQRFEHGTVVALNQFPYMTGHILLMPSEHYEEYTEMSDVQMLEWMKVRSWASRILRKIYRAPGLNTGTNQGIQAGQSQKHIHEHGVPKTTEGFLGVLAKITMVGETLSQTHERMVSSFSALNDVMRDKDYCDKEWDLSMFVKDNDGK